MSIAGNEFLLIHTFGKVASIEETEIMTGPIEHHFGIPWELSAAKLEGHLHVRLGCNLPKEDDKWSVSAEVKAQLVSSKRRMVERIFTPTYSSGDTFDSVVLMPWEALEKKYSVDDSFHIHVLVKINEARGVPRQKLVLFDTPEPTHELLVVEDQKFYVDKQFLAGQSTVFENLFFSKLNGSDKKEFTLININAPTFQIFLEDVHKADVINDDTVEGILKLAKHFDVEDSIKRCIKFLVKESEKSIKDKLKLAKDHDMEVLRNFCLTKLDTKEKIMAIIPGAADMDSEVYSFLLKKLGTY